jgi:hypothetical protein
VLLGYNKRPNKKKKKAVSFLGFDASRPPAQVPALYPRLKYDEWDCWEASVHCSVNEIVLNLLIVGLGYEKMPIDNRGYAKEFDVKGHQNGLSNNFREVTDEDEEGPHALNSAYYMLQIEEAKRANELGWWDINLYGRFDDRAFSKYKEWVEPRFIWDELILPIAFAFVHQTDWCPSLRRFRKFVGPWLEHSKTLIRSDEFVKHVEEDISDEWNYNDCFFWNGWETAVNHGCIANLFVNKLEEEALKLVHIIEVLDELFPRKKKGKEQTWQPKESEDIVQRRVWEMWVIDWICDKSDI